MLPSGQHFVELVWQLVFPDRGIYFVGRPRVIYYDVTSFISFKCGNIDNFWQFHLPNEIILSMISPLLTGKEDRNIYFQNKMRSYQPFKGFSNWQCCMLFITDHATLLVFVYTFVHHKLQCLTMAEVYSSRRIDFELRWISQCHSIYNFIITWYDCKQRAQFVIKLNPKSLLTALIQRSWRCHQAPPHPTKNYLLLMGQELWGNTVHIC